MDERENKTVSGQNARQQTAQNRRPGSRGSEERRTGVRRPAGDRPAGKKPVERRPGTEGRRPVNRRQGTNGQVRPVRKQAEDTQIPEPVLQNQTASGIEGTESQTSDQSSVRQVRQAERPNAKRPDRRKKSSRSRRRKRNVVLRVLIIIVLLMVCAGGFIFWKKYGSSKERADLNEYYGIQASDDLAVVVNDRAIGQLNGYSAGGKIFNGVPYVEYSVVRDFVNSWFYWDYNENVLLYTLPNGSVSVGVGSSEYTDIKEKKTKDYVILKTEGRTAYIALPFIQEFTNMEYELFESKDNAVPSRAVIECDWGEHAFSELKRDTEVRYQGGVKSPIMTEVKKSEKVRVLADEDNWMKIRTEDGYIGYVKTSTLKKVKNEVTSRDFKEPEYTSIQAGGTINMAWHNVDNTTANSYVLETIASTKGLTTIAPTWFSIADTNGNITSIASADYVNYAHQSNLQVWGVFRDFHGGINSYDETFEVLSYTSKRETLINQVIGAALQVGLDGINLDFELISNECGEHFIQFIRELSVKCRQNGLVFSVDNYVPMPYNEHHRLDEQAKAADYVVIMGYDEHAANSYEPGSVASYNYVKKGIEDSLKLIPRDKLINAIPLYTRLWYETPKTKEEREQDAGTEAEEYAYKVTSTAMGMEEAEETLKEVGVEPVWDEKTRQYYAEWEAEGGVYKIWLEEERSIEEKLKLIKENQLAGVASWRLGWEKDGIWDLILQYVN